MTQLPHRSLLQLTGKPLRSTVARPSHGTNSKRLMFLPCYDCDDGRNWTSRYGGNDPDVWSDGPCPTCYGTGVAWCCENRCSKPAVKTWADEAGNFTLCREHYAQWHAEMAECQQQPSEYPT
jgi:hypothetical protein